MHIDTYTVTALVVFVIMLAVFVRFCQVKVCGMAARVGQVLQDGQASTSGTNRHENRAAHAEPGGE